MRSMPPPRAVSLHKAIEGCLLGTAVGDSLGLPFEGLSPQRIARFWTTPEHHQFFAGKGALSDDTEHAILVAQSLVESGADPAFFQRRLAHRLRLWFLGLPAGIGFGTLRSLLKLLIGVSPERSGVFTAGNGPAMRASLLGVVAGHDPILLQSLVSLCTRITHTDPKAEWGALVVAQSARLAMLHTTPEPRRVLASWRSLLPDEAGEMVELLEQVVNSVERGEDTADFAAQMGLEKGITGYMLHTVPVVVHCWLSNPADAESGLVKLIRCGGDTDTTAAILGGIVGAGVGKAGLPQRWLEGLVDVPRTVQWMEELALQLSRSWESQQPEQALRLSPLTIAARNFVFTLLVLGHGFRRLLPPYQ